MSGGHAPRRVRQRHVDWLLERLSSRDWEILKNLRTVRLLTSSQIERLAFSSLSGRSRSVIRARVLKRLVDWRVLMPLARRIGGMAHGSSEMVYSLDSAGQALATILANKASGEQQRVRRPSLPGVRFIRHVLAVSEVYVRLVEITRTADVQLVDFRAEPDAWLPDGLGGLLKPDAFAVLAAGEVEDHWFIEVDLATEHLPTVRRKLETYLDFLRRGQLGPLGVMPRVLVIVPDERRQEALQVMLDRLPAPADVLLHVITATEAVPYLVRVLRE